MNISLIPFVVVFWVIELFAQPSQPPSPTPGKSTQNNKGKAASKEPVASNNQSNADSVSAAINKLTAEIASWKNKQSTEEGKENTPSDWWSDFDWWSRAMTITTGFATLAIAGLGCFQWWAMHKQAGYMREGLILTKQAADAASESARVAEETLYLSQRAYLSIGSWQTADIKQAPIQIYFVVSNSGHTTGTIHHIYSKFTTATELPEAPVYGTPNSVSFPIAPGVRFGLPLLLDTIWRILTTL